MATKLFKTKKLAEKYIHENHPNCSTHHTAIDERSNWDAVDIPDLQWQGETPALDVKDENFNTIATVAWWEEGDDEYELFVGDKLSQTFDNIFDAREAFNKASETEEDKDEEEEEIFEVKLFCNGEDITN